MNIKEIFNKLFSKSNNIDKQVDVNMLVTKYTTANQTDNIYGFQNKYLNQEQVLYKIYGESNKNLNNKLKLIIITDTHNMLKSDDLINIINEHPDYDACFLLGDHSARDVEIVLDYIDKSKIYALLGNHDYNYIQEFNLFNLNGQVININDVMIAGIEGSFKYKPSDFPSYTQEDSVKFLNSLPRCDILFSHDGPFRNSSSASPAHQGLFGITYYLFKNNVKYNVHGHLHEPYEKILLNGTKEISMYMVNYIELD